MLAVGVSLALLVSCASPRSAESARSAQRLMDEARFAEAAHAWARLAKEDPKNANVLYNYLYARYAAEEYDALLSEVEPAIGRFPARLEFLRLKARTLLQAGRLDEAEKTYRTLMALNEADHAFLAVVMEEAHARGLSSLAEDLARLLLHEPAYKERSLKLLNALYPGQWYEPALAFIRHRD